MNFNFFVNTQMPGGVTTTEELASLGEVEGWAPAMPLPQDQLEAMVGGAGPGVSAMSALELAPLSVEELVSMESDPETVSESEAPIPVEQLEAMVGYGSEGFLAVGGAELAPMSEEALTSLSAMEGSEGMAEPPLNVGELEALTVGEGVAGLPALDPIPEEELSSMGETGSPSVPSSTESVGEASSRPKRRAGSRAKPKAG